MRPSKISVTPDTFSGRNPSSYRSPQAGVGTTFQSPLYLFHSVLGSALFVIVIVVFLSPTMLASTVHPIFLTSKWPVAVYLGRQLDTV